STRCLSWPPGASSTAGSPQEESRVRTSPRPLAPPRPRRSARLSSPKTPWQSLPAERQRQVQQFLGRLLARLIAARRNSGVGRDLSLPHPHNQEPPPRRLPHRIHPPV